MKFIILFGKPGAGKGTRFSKFLEGRENEYQTLSVSSLLRKERAEQTELGKQLAAYMDSGALVPDELINKIVIGAILAAEGNMVADGFPRTVGQAEALLAAGVNPEDIKVIELYVEDEVVIQRAKDRIVCKDCGEPYTTNYFKKPKTEGICDKCGGALVRRTDDEEEVVKKRLKVYQDETLPVLKVLEDAGVEIVKIDNTTSDSFKEFEKAMTE